jgi:hypothetical protein
LNPRNKIATLLSREGIQELVFFIPLFLLCLYLSYDINFLNPGNSTLKIRSDKALYYVYLPATFIYGWDASKFPPGIEKRCEGFLLNKKNNKVIIKMTCGVAILWTPFFLVTHFIAVHWNLQPDGFSDFYEKMTFIPGVFYLVLGLFFLRRFLGNYFSRSISYITVLLIFAGTNLYFYGIAEGLMSHVNSFFLFALFLYLLKKFIENETLSYGLVWGLSVVLSLAILIRPTNILLLTPAIFLDVNSWKDLITRLKLFFKPWIILIFLFIAFIVFLPQFLYWNYLTGHFIWYSYSGESFSNWNNPPLIPVWFSTLNGLFLYTPLALFFIAGIILMIVKKIPNGIFMGLSFLIVSYIFASWYCWYFGGSFGFRPMVEYYALFSLPFAYFISTLWRLKNLYIKSLLILLILFSVNYNIRTTYHQRWNIYSTWSWDDYLIFLQTAGMYSYPWHSYIFIQDFENFGIPEISPVQNCVHSMFWAGYVDKSIEYNRLFYNRMYDILGKPIKQVNAELWINPDKNLKTGARFVCKIEDKLNKLSYYKDVKIDDFLKGSKQWSKLSASFEIPEWVDQSNTISFLMWNAAKKDTIYFDDLKLKFE